MSERASSSILTAAVTALAGFATGCSDAAKPTADVSGKPTSSAAASTTLASASANAAAPTEKKACCAGKNECKGLGGCKTDKTSCSGKNDCKGLGGCMHRDCKKL